MTSSIFFEKRDFLRNKGLKGLKGGSKAGPGLACNLTNLGFAKEKGLEPTVKKVSKIV